MEEADTNAAPHRSKPRFRKRRILGAVLLALPLLWLGWRSAVSRMDFPRLIIRPPLPALKPPQELDGSPTIGASTISPDGKIVWTGSAVPFVNIGKKFYRSPLVLPIYAWDAHTGQQMFSLPGHLRQVSALACSPDGRWLASSGWDFTMKLWNVQTHQLVWSRPGGSPTLVFSADSKQLADGGRICDVGTGAVVRTFRLPQGVSQGEMDELRGAAFSPDGHTLACVDDQLVSIPATKTEQSANIYDHLRGHRILLWDVATGRLRTTLPYDQTQDMVYSPDGRWLASVGSNGQVMGSEDGASVRVVDAVTGAERWRWENRDNIEWNMICLTYSPNGKWLAAEMMSHDVVLFNAATGKVFKRLHAYELPHGGSFQLTHSALAFSSDGKTLVGRGDNTVQVWDTSSLP